MRERRAILYAWTLRFLAAVLALVGKPEPPYDAQALGAAALFGLAAGMAFSFADAARDRVIADRATRAARGDDRVCDHCRRQRPAEHFDFRWPDADICDACSRELRAEDEIERAFAPRGQSLRGLSPTDPRSDHHAD